MDQHKYNIMNNILTLHTTNRTQGFLPTRTLLYGNEGEQGTPLHNHRDFLNFFRNRLMENLQMPFKKNRSVGTKSGLHTGVASHGTDFRIPKAKMCSLEASHAPEFRGFRIRWHYQQKCMPVCIASREWVHSFHQIRKGVSESKESEERPQKEAAQVSKLLSRVWKKGYPPTLLEGM